VGIHRTRADNISFSGRIGRRVLNPNLLSLPQRDRRRRTIQTRDAEIRDRPLTRKTPDARSASLSPSRRKTASLLIDPSATRSALAG